MKLILIPIVVGALAQVIKFLVKSIKHKRLSRRSWLGYGGWPSVHTATVVSLITVVWLEDGLDSTTFAIALAFTALTIRDALGLRNFLGEHGKILNRLISDMPKKFKNSEYPNHLREHLGHTPMEVLAGALVGFILSWLFYVNL